MGIPATALSEPESKAECRIPTGIAPSGPPGAFAVTSKPDKRFREPARLHWIGNSLHLDGKGKAIVTIERDAKYPDVMWRVRLPDGTLLGMLNKTRCKDAATAYASRMLGG